MRTFQLLIVCFTLAHVAGRLQAAPPELKRIHVLVALDTTSDLKDELVIDRHRLVRLLHHGIPADRLDLKFLTGAKLTPASVLAHYQHLRISPDEGLVFFYGGHGAMDPKKGHYLQLQNGKKGAELIRADLRKAMEARKPGLVVILTDCCSNARRLGKRNVEADEAHVKTRGQFNPLLRSLFFQARGTVDITAATGHESIGNDVHGGLFTATLCKLLAAPPATLDTSKDGVVSWPEFFHRLRRETETTFHAWKKEARKANGGKDVDLPRNQTPHAFALGHQGNNARTWAVVSLTNETARPLHYSVRWSIRSNWEKKELAPGKRAVHALPLARPDQDVALLARIEVGGSVQSPKLKVNRYSGDRPGFENGRKYRWRPRTARALRRSIGNGEDRAGEARDGDLTAG
jgi:hypothetical protein